MKKSAWLALPAVLVLLVALAAPQSHNTFPTPPPSLDTTASQKPEATPVRRIDLEQLQKEADDLARTAQTIPSDVASVRKGMLPKDVIDKLKQIEKLSKRLRTELNP
ncbi:MAG: hypothetical protein ABSE44_08605 [Candidatus Sulfotelmatobacter sp.]